MGALSETFYSRSCDPEQGTTGLLGLAFKAQEAHTAARAAAVWEPAGTPRVGSAVCRWVLHTETSRGSGNLLAEQLTRITCSVTAHGSRCATW